MKKMSEVEKDVLGRIPIGHRYAVKKDELTEQTGYSERDIRKAIAELRRGLMILNLQDGSGYFIPAEEDEKLVTVYVKQEMNQARAIFKSLKAAREFVGEKQIPGQVTVEEAIEMFEEMAAGE